MACHVTIYTIVRGGNGLLPNHAALDKIRESSAIVKLVEASYKYTEPKPSKSMLLRRFGDVKVMYEPKK
jgi:hypothetical protein